MHIFHLSRRRITLLFLFLLLTVVLVAVLTGRRGSLSAPQETVLPTDADRVTYLESLGWQVDGGPLETLMLRLPEDLMSSWADYVALQDEQSFPFSAFAGETVSRYTYHITNYPGVPKGVQANLYLCDDSLIGGDIIATGENGFQAILAFPVGSQ